MATNILTTDTATLNSSEFTLTAGESATLSLKGSGTSSPPAGTRVFVQIKDDTGAWVDFERLAQRNSPLVINGAGTFRVRRVDTGVSVGVFRG